MINLGKISEGTTSKDVLLEKRDNMCIECISHCKDSDGYTRIKYNGKHERLFRVLYELKNGKIPKGKVLRHLCNNSWCCNVEHLKVGTQKENCQDMVECGRSQKGKKNLKISGENNNNNKLTNKQVEEIYLSELSNRKLAEIYNVSPSNISLIKNKKQWSWLTDKLD